MIEGERIPSLQATQGLQMPAQDTEVQLTYAQIVEMPDVKAAKTLEEQDALILSRFRQSRDRVAMQERGKRLQEMLSKPGGI